MVSAIVYHSQTGSCKRYADLLSARLHIPAYADGTAPTRSDGQVIYVSWAFAGKVMGLKKARKKYKLAGVVMVGMSPVFPNSVANGRKANDISPDVAFFCLQGAFNINKLPGYMRLIMRLKSKDIVAQLEKAKAGRELTEPEKALYKMASTGVGEPPAWDVSEVAEYFLVDGGGLHQDK